MAYDALGVQGEGRSVHRADRIQQSGTRFAGKQRRPDPDCRAASGKPRCGHRNGLPRHGPTRCRQAVDRLHGRRRRRSGLALRPLAPPRGAFANPRSKKAMRTVSPLESDIADAMKRYRIVRRMARTLPKVKTSVETPFQLIIQRINSYLKTTSIGGTLYLPLSGQRTIECCRSPR